MVAAVAPATAEQAVWLRDERGVSDVELLLDPDHVLRSRVDLGRFRLRGIVSLRGVWNYVKAIVGGGRQGRIHGYDLQPGVIVADETLTVVWVWRGTTYGDYPMVDDVLAEIDS